MRVALFALAVLAGVGVFLVMRESGTGRTHRRDGLDEEEQRARPTRTDSPDESVAEKAKRARPTRRVIYADGTPAADIALRIAVGRPFRTRIFRNGDHPEKVIWLVTALTAVRTNAKGEFRPPRGERRIAFTEADSLAYVLAEIDDGDVPAVRRVRVTGLLRAKDGGDYNRSWVAAQSTAPEDWSTRYTKEKDSFVGAGGDLGVDPGARVEVLSDANARFELRVVPGRTWLVFGEHGRLGVQEVLVGDRDVDLGEIVIGPKKQPEQGNEAIHGFVLDCAGNPRPEAKVLLWDGNVGEPSHYVYTDDRGRFECKGLQSPHVIAWATSSVTEPHVILPQQSSGTIRLPCNTPVTLTAPGEKEYHWLASDTSGHHLFVRDGVFLGSGYLGGVDRIGLPPGKYHILAVAGGKLYETDYIVIEGGQGRLKNMRELG